MNVVKLCFEIIFNTSQVLEKKILKIILYKCPLNVVYLYYNNVGTSNWRELDIGADCKVHSCGINRIIIEQLCKQAGDDN